MPRPRDTRQREWPRKGLTGPRARPHQPRVQSGRPSPWTKCWLTPTRRPVQVSQSVEGEGVFRECLGRGNVPAVARVEADRALHGKQVEPPQPVRAPRQEPRRAAARIAWMIHHCEVSLLTHARLWATLV